jgi:hypothetical protein
LVTTIVGLYENIEHRFCVKHLYGNWRKRYSGDDLKEAFWCAARANTVTEFTKAMDKPKKMSEHGWKELSKYPHGMWSRAGYSTHTYCDLQVNNMCEAFNSAIL